MYKKPFFLIATIFTVIFIFGSLFLFYSLPTQSAYQELEEFSLEEEVMSEIKFNVLPENKEIEKIVVPKKITDIKEPFINQGFAIVMDDESGKIIFSKDANKKKAIASITKLATALVFLDNNPGWDIEYEIKYSDRVNGGKIYLFSGEKVKVKDLFYLSLVGSANTATLALVNSTGLSKSEFVKAMNKKAKELNLKNTNFVDPIGLSYLNQSTAYEVAKLAKTALANNDISRAVLSEKYSFTTAGNREKIVYNTDSLLKSFPVNDIVLLGGKTGYTDTAGYCFVGKFKNENNQEIFAVILGGEDNNYRFQKTKELVEWTYNNFSWRQPR